MEEDLLNKKPMICLDMCTLGHQVALSVLQRSAVLYNNV